jgi:hypothetical protein
MTNNALTATRTTLAGPPITIPHQGPEAARRLHKEFRHFIARRQLSGLLQERPSSKRHSAFVNDNHF